MGHHVSRVIVHVAVPAAKRALAGTMAGLSGNVTEHSVELHAIDGGPSALWSESQDRAGESWWGASQAFAATIAQAMLASGYIKGTESWYVAFWEDTGELISGGPETIPLNTPEQPSDTSFGAFLAAIGCERVESDGF